MLTKNKSYIKIPRKEWEALKKIPTFGEIIELLEDQADLLAARRKNGKDISLTEYLKKRGIRSNT